MVNKAFSFLNPGFLNPGMLILLGILCGCGQGNSVISLEGKWGFRIDSSDAGIAEAWYAGNQDDIIRLDDEISLPGSMTTNGKGYDPFLAMKWTGSIYDSSWYFNPEMAPFRQPGNLKFPFWLNPVKYYVGAAWYCRQVNVPESWRDRRTVLFLERVHTESMLWVDGREAGMQNSLVAPHVYDLTGMLPPGKHTLCLRIDNRIKEINVGPDSHSITDNTQGNWNGVIGRIELQSTPLTWIEEVQVYPDLENASARIRVLVRDRSGDAGEGSLSIEAKSFNTEQRHHVHALKTSLKVRNGEEWFEYDLPMGDDFLAWDEFQPALYRLKVSLQTEKNGSHETRLQFGMREFGRNGTRFTVNGRPVFLRGNVNCAAFPLTGHPPMDAGSWEDLFILLKKYGFNHVRYHSWCPPEAAFIAADRVGFYLQPEGPSWPNHGVSLGDGLPIDRYLYDETHRMERYYGNHPSWVMLSSGNEPGGRHQAEYLGKFVNHWKERDPRRMYTGASVASGWPWVPEAEYIIRSSPRGLPWKQRPQSLFDHRRIIGGQSVPYVSHEIGQYCAFPDFGEIGEYTGVMKARNFELFRAILQEHDMGDQARDFLMASGKLQLLCYKHEIEAALRTPGFGGFQMLSLNDFPGQGTALVGVLNALYREKGYATAEEFSRFCNSTVPLARIPKFVYYNTDTFRAAIEMYHFGPAPLEDAGIAWKITDPQGRVLAGDTLNRSLPIGNTIPITGILFGLSEITEPTRLNLEVAVEDSPFVNDWDFWVYPEKLPETGVRSIESSGILIRDTLDDEVWQALGKGGRVFLNVPGKIEKGKEVVMHFSPVFWNTSWFQMRPPHVTGILCNPEHPVFNDFPTEAHSDLQWWEILHGQQVMLLDSFPKGFRPLIQPIDTWFLSRKLGSLLEARVGKGKIVICSLDLLSDPDHRPAARQLFYSIEKYMVSGDFKPEFEVDPRVIRELFLPAGQRGSGSHTRESPEDLVPKTN
jgi:hypothetical protein